jgi:cytoskeletal protein RodZ
MREVHILKSNSSTELIRKARESKNLTLEQLEKETKIPVAHLKLIEEGDFASLPAHVSGTQYIRSIATLLELDPQPILREYQLVKRGQRTAATAPTTPPEEPVFLSRRETYRLKQKQRKAIPLLTWLSKWYIYVPIILILVLIPIGVWWWSSSSDPVQVSGSSAKTGSGQSNLTSEQPKEQEENPVQVKLTDAAEANDAKVDVYEVTNANQLEVKVEAKEAAKVLIRAKDRKGEILFRDTLDENQSKVVTHQEGIYLRLYKPSQMMLTVNGVVIETAEQEEALAYEFKLNP